MKKFHIGIVLDRSGSMASQKDDHLGGLRTFIKDQQNQGPTDFTFVQFDGFNPFELIYDGVDINSVNTDEIDLIPRGSTPLLDSLGKSLAHLTEKTKNEPDTQVVLMVITDGQENCSKEWNVDKIKKEINARPTWKIMYLGSDLNGFHDASSYGISCDASLLYANNPDGVGNMYKANIGSITRMRHSYSKGLDNVAALNCSNYTEEERANAVLKAPPMTQSHQSHPDAVIMTTSHSSL